jgi:hypothetical protein
MSHYLLSRVTVSSILTISGIRASCTNAMGCAVAGLTGHPIGSLTLRDIRIKFPGNDLATDSLRSFGEKAGYPECTVFAKRLPAYGFYFWHVRGLSISDMALTTAASDARPTVGPGGRLECEHGRKGDSRRRGSSARGRASAGQASRPARG